MATFKSQSGSHGSPAAGLNAHAPDFNPQSHHLPSDSPSLHRTKSFYFEPTRDMSQTEFGQEVEFKRRTASDCFLHANPTSQASLQGNGNGSLASTGTFDPFVTATAPLSAAAAVGAVQANPYSPETTAALGGAAFFAGQTGFQQPVSSLGYFVYQCLTIIGSISSLRPDWAS